MELTFWGTRGSIATPGADTLEFGGNTSCMELRAAGEILIFDCGTGIRPLGNHLLACEPQPFSASLFISHVHWDHIQGFPFFGPLFVPGNSFTIFGPQEQYQRLSDTLAGQMQYRYFPVNIDQLSATLRYQELREETLALGQLRITTRYLNHTTMTMAYRVELGKRAVVYATDHEPFAQRPRAWIDPEIRAFAHRSDAALADFCRGADVLVLDGQYRSDEYVKRIGWGHGTFDYGLDLAISADVNTLVFYHHEPLRSDRALAAEVETCRARLRADGSSLEVLAAAEGLKLTLADQPAVARDRSMSPIPLFRPQVHVALIGLDEAAEEEIERSLPDSFYRLQSFAGQSLAQHIPAFHPDALLLGSKDLGLVSQVRKLVGNGPGGQPVPLLLLLPGEQSDRMEAAFSEGATDVLVMPTAPSQLRSRLDSWLFRGGIAVERRRHARPPAEEHAQAG
ncbi:MAG: MBL fold metallo-hydrolase [Chloroflexota bacterium]